MDSRSSRAMVVIWPLVLLIFSQFAGSDSLEYLHTHEHTHRHKRTEGSLNITIVQKWTFAAKLLLEFQQLWAFYLWKCPLSGSMFITIISNTSQAPLKYYSDMESGTYVHRAYHNSSSLAWRPMKTWTHTQNSQETLLTTSLLFVPTQPPQQLSSLSPVDTSTERKVTAGIKAYISH